jgi:predicted Zn-ribbon and HTH transcriptional regulator
VEFLLVHGGTTMAALTSRKESRQRLLKLFEKSLDWIIPEEPSTPLRGQTFRDFEEQAEELRRTMLPAVLEERVGLESTALVEEAGMCPFCASERVLLERGSEQREVISPHGAVVLTHQRARCRSCGRSFSPAGAGVGPAGGGQAHAAGGRAGGAGDGGAEV